MTPVEQFLRWLLTLSIWDVGKVMVLVGLTLYLVFGVVMVRQVGLMRDTLEVEHDWWVTVLSWMHLLVAVLIWVVAWVIL